MHRRPPVAVIIIVIIAIVAAGAYFLYTENTKAADGALTASGTVETIQISIAPELGGKIAEINVEEGDPVSAGDVLFRIDDTIYQAQRNVAAAALDTAKSAAATADAAVATAQAQYDLAVIAARNESAAARTSQWRIPQPGDFNQPNWYFTKVEQTAAAQMEVDAAAQALEKAQSNLAEVENKAASSDFLDAEKTLAEARAAYQVASDVNARAGESGDADLKDAAQKIFDDAIDTLTDAQDKYDDLLDTDSAQDVLTARAELAVAQERTDLANDRLRALQTGDESPKVTVATKVLEQARLAAEQAHTAIAQAEANLALIDTQIAKLTVHAPVDGVVLTRSIQPGEVASPGGVTLTIGRLDSLTITVYVPEDRVGEVSLGQSADVKVDAFPDVTFSATVTHIADQAEFTPRNVQTVEGRKSTVFAIKLKLNDPADKIKPGMPADVTFK